LLIGYAAQRAAVADRRSEDAVAGQAIRPRPQFEYLPLDIEALLTELCQILVERGVTHTLEALEAVDEVLQGGCRADDRTLQRHPDRLRNDGELPVDLGRLGD